jgi:hypothetical protein
MFFHHHFAAPARIGTPVLVSERLEGSPLIVV